MLFLTSKRNNILRRPRLSKQGAVSISMPLISLVPDLPASASADCWEAFVAAASLKNSADPEIVPFLSQLKNKLLYIKFTFL